MHRSLEWEISLPLEVGLFSDPQRSKTVEIGKVASLPQQWIYTWMHCWCSVTLRSIVNGFQFLRRKLLVLLLRMPPRCVYSSNPLQQCSMTYLRLFLNSILICDLLVLHWNRFDLVMHKNKLPKLTKWVSDNEKSEYFTHPYKNLNFGWLLYY